MIISATDLKQASTFGDFFSLSFPYSAGTLKNPKEFASAHQHLNCRLVEKDTSQTQPFETKRWNRMSAKTKGGHPRHLNPNNRAFFDATRMIIENEKALYGIELPEKWVLTLEGSRFSKGSNTSTKLHTEGSTAQKRLYLCASNNPTFIVPHNSILEILSNSPIARILDQSINNPEAIRLFNRHTSGTDHENHGINKQFDEAAIQADANTVTVMTFLTPHRRPAGMDRSRVFLKANAYDR